MRIGTLATALLALAVAPAMAAESDGHLNVPVGQHVQASFLASAPGSNLYKLAALGFADGSLRLGARLPAGTTLVLTDVHVQIFRFGTNVSQPLDGFIQLSSGDVTGATEGVQLTNIPLEAAAGVQRTGTTHSFTAGFAFKGNRSPEVIALTDASVTDLHILASGYLVRAHR
jgi:hypothetical protein